MNSCCGSTPELGDVTLTALAVLGIGLTTSLGHCIGMCGPLLTTFSLAQARNEKRMSRLAPGLLIYHAGRINSYMIIGLVMGLLAHFARASAPAAQVRGILFGASGILMVLMGLGLAGRLPTTRLVESSPLGKFVAQRFMALIGTTSMMGRYLLGVANGFLPCGPVYAVAMSALTAPTPLHGAGTMGLFGLGTMPVLLAIGLGAGRLGASLQRRFNMVAAILVIFMGLEFLIRAGKMFGLVKAIKWEFIPVW